MADDFVIVVEGLDELQKVLEQFPSELSRAANQIMTPAMLIVVNEVRQEGRADLGVATASFGSTTHPKGIHQISTVGSQIVGEMGSKVEYAPYALEYGREPGKMPPPDRLEEWAGRHGMPGMGFVIARAIGRRGVTAPHTISNAMAKKKDEVVRKIEDGIRKVLEGLHLL